MKRKMSLVCATMLAGLLISTIGCAKAPSDSQMTEQIQSKLTQDSGLQGHTIAVQSSDGTVTLSGTVDNDAQRAAAARYAASVPGVKQVINNLQVGTPAAVAAASAPEPSLAPAPKATAKPMAESRHMAAAPSRTKPRASVPRNRPRSSDMDTATSQTSDSMSAGMNKPPDPATQAAATAPVSAAPAPPPPPPPPKKMTIDSGTTLAVRLVDGLDSETAQPGETFRATLDSPLASEGEIAIPAGYNVEGHVVDVKSAGKFAGQSLLVLQLDRVLVTGKSYSLQTNQYRRQGGNRTTNTVEKVGAGAAIGAIIGGIAGGGKGAGIGAAAGGGLGGGVQAATKGQQIKLASETVLNFTLESPLTVTKVDQGPDAGRRKLDPPQQ